jgi:hypothetical protein
LGSLTLTGFIRDTPVRAGPRGASVNRTPPGDEEERRGGEQGEEEVKESVGDGRLMRACPRDMGPEPEPESEPESEPEGAKEGEPEIEAEARDGGGTEDSEATRVRPPGEGATDPESQEEKAEERDEGRKDEPAISTLTEPVTAAKDVRAPNMDISPATDGARGPEAEEEEDGAEGKRAVDEVDAMQVDSSGDGAGRDKPAGGEGEGQQGEGEGMMMMEVESAGDGPGPAKPAGEEEAQGEGMQREEATPPQPIIPIPVTEQVEPMVEVTKAGESARSPDGEDKPEDEEEEEAGQKDEGERDTVMIVQRDSEEDGAGATKPAGEEAEGRSEREQHEKATTGQPQRESPATVTEELEPPMMDLDTAGDRAHGMDVEEDEPAMTGEEAEGGKGKGKRLREDDAEDEDAAGAKKSPEKSVERASKSKDKDKGKARDKASSPSTGPLGAASEGVEPMDVPDADEAGPAHRGARAKRGRARKGAEKPPEQPTRWSTAEAEDVIGVRGDPAMSGGRSRSSEMEGSGCGWDAAGACGRSDFGSRGAQRWPSCPASASRSPWSRHRQEHMDIHVGGFWQASKVQRD